jgi:hypothetical protein
MYPLRNVSERFLTLGSYHILADDLRVGWHPDYRDHFPQPIEERAVKRASRKRRRP